MNKVKEFFLDFVSLFYPRFCVGCGCSLRKGEENLCLSCLLGLPKANDCDKSDNSVERRFYGKVEVEYGASFLRFEKEGIAQRILHEIKYHDNKEFGRQMGRMFGASMKRGRFKCVDAIVPVPLHPNKLRKRGYNQSEWIAKGISDELGVPVWTDVLVRTVENTTQTRKNAEERWENVKGIFALSEERDIQGKHLLVVDDVLTTGSTLEACVLPLNSVPNLTVSVAALAAVE